MPLNYNRFPAAVVTSDGQSFNRCAVVVIDGHAELGVQGRGGDFAADEVHTVATLDGVTVGPAGPMVLLTGDDGRTWEVRDGDGCGCRSPLQAWYGRAIQGQPAGT